MISTRQFPCNLVRPCPMGPNSNHHPFSYNCLSVTHFGPPSGRFLNTATYPLQELDYNDRLKDIYAAITHGNHQSAMSNFDLLKSIMETEVEYGYALPIPIKTIYCIPNAAVAPLGIVFQDTIDEFGKVKE